MLLISDDQGLADCGDNLRSVSPESGPHFIWSTAPFSGTVVAHGSSGRSRRQPRPSYLTCCANTFQKGDGAQRVDELNFSCIRIYGCATRGTKRPWAAKFLHICRQITTMEYLVTAHNCSGFAVWVSALREGFSATEWRYARFDSEYMIRIDL
jgi:hypothetical protein